MKLAKTFIAGMALALSVGANADWITAGNTGIATTQANGELILTIWNPDTLTSYTQDLGITTRQFMDGTAGELTINLNAAGLAHVAGSNLLFNIAGYNSTFDGADVSSAGFYLTSPTGPNDTLIESGFGQLPGYSQFLDGYKIAIQNGTVIGTGDNLGYLLSGATYAGAGSTWGDSMRGLPGQFSWGSTAGDASSPLAGFAWGLDNTTFQTGDPVQSAIAGAPAFWTLDLTSGTLKYSAVPVPAAVWLFGSALLGLAGAIRRRQKV